MKKLLALIIPGLYFCNATAQSPQALNYQAIARTSDGAIMSSQNIGIRFSILDQTPSGAILYSETHQTTTNAYGLFTLAIGKGTAVTSKFSNIDWANGTDKFLNVEIAPAEGSGYQLQGTTQLLSVPYALYAARTKLIAGNNTIKITNGNSITTNFQAGIGIKIRGNIISHNFVAGNGITITGNTISTINTASPGENGLWRTDANGIYRGTNIGIRTNSRPTYSLISNGDIPGVYEGNAGLFTSTSEWHTNIAIRNYNTQYTFIVGGPGNREVLPNNFGIYNSNTARWPFTINGANNNIGIGDPSRFPSPPKSALHIKQGDIFIDQVKSGIIMRSPNGKCWRVIIDNSGNFVKTSINCPS